MKRHAIAIWEGSGKNGKGNLTTQTSVLDKAAYSFKSRFEDGYQGTNPEELVAAAHAGCFSMQLAVYLEDEEFSPDKLETKCDITIENGTITHSDLTLKAKVPGISEEKFMECVNRAKVNCPVSKLLNAEISINATLETEIEA